MGLSSEQVSSSGLDWNNNLMEAQKLELLPKPHHNEMKKSSESLKCPRCDSTNTKFCYYNNYNKSQPRHFCRDCKRHWTKGGTLRNVPVGGVRKNKRLKKPTTTTTSCTLTTSTSIVDGVLSSNMNNIQTSLAVSDQKNMPSSSLYQAMIRPSSLLLQQQNLMNMRDLESKDFGIGNGMTLSSTLPLHQNQTLLFPFSTSFYTNPCSVSTTSLRSSSNVYNYVEESTINSVIPSTSSGINTQTLEIPATSGGIGMSNYWSWEDIDSFVSTDLKNPWDDSDIKP
ncbi:hypothetical protein TanjilG_21683 [Lupinus angustifolius]|uniref:Dof zinc finger protein n=1 Tax=Lupinus angustifolius TaxID=3871 RepID=A0A1J7G206_LUPAN|nr:PREDICTED: dof zinc finger protein DOF2.4-like [Lupinus angustifolius]OIV94343.1 hypothetical protein TanjilG_21683 [Lupinus angustifolius]